MLRLIGLLVVIAAAGYFTNPTEATHRDAAGAVLRTQADAAANNLDIGGLIETGAAALTQDGVYDNFYVASKYTVSTGGHPYIECWGAFTKVMCNRTAQGDAQPAAAP